MNIEYNKLSRHNVQVMGPNFWNILILFMCIFIAYSNTWFSSWHLDDFPNIINNNAIHIEKITPYSLYGSFFSHPVNTGKLFRPVASLSFALNWYMGRDSVFGYHLVNIILHFFSAVFLYFSIFLLLNAPWLKKRIANKHAVSLLASTLWAINPIQTQAVTYIVQRMALLAGFFYIASIFFYLKARLLKKSKLRQSFFLIASLFCFILAIGSKENAITLPFSLFFIELIFFNSFQKNHWRMHLYIILPFLCILTGGVIFFSNGQLDTIFSGYEQRSFTLYQRLLTEPRIIFHYLSQIFYPIPSRFSLDHDIIISTSLATPISTLLSLIFLFILITGSLIYFKKYPLITFSLLFFFLNHIIESSFIPLELIFEHRNYLPSMFLFLPISAGIAWTLERYGSQTKWVRTALYCFCLLLIAELGLSTFQRNNVWATEQSLWEDGLKKAPGSSRPYINLAFVYRQKGYDKIAFNLCRQSLNKFSPTPEKDRMRAYNNMGLIMMDYNKFPAAITYFSKAITSKQNIQSRYYLHQALLANGDIEQAKKMLYALSMEFPNDSHLQTSMGIILTKMKKYPEAESFFHKAIENSRQDFKEQLQATICLGSLYSRQGQYQKAEKTFLLARSLMPTATPIICLLGNELRKKNFHQAAIIRKNLLKTISRQQLLKIPTTSYRNNLIFPVEAQQLSQYIINGTKTTQRDP